MFYGLTTNQKFYEKHISVFIALAPCALIANTNKAAQMVAYNMYWIIEKLDWMLDL